MTDQLRSNGHEDVSGVQSRDPTESPLYKKPHMTCFRSFLEGVPTLLLGPLDHPSQLEKQWKGAREGTIIKAVNDLMDKQPVSIRMCQIWKCNGQTRWRGKGWFSFVSVVETKFTISIWIVLIISILFTTFGQKPHVHTTLNRISKSVQKRKYGT